MTGEDDEPAFVVVLVPEIEQAEDHSLPMMGVFAVATRLYEILLNSPDGTLLRAGWGKCPTCGVGLVVIQIGEVSSRLALGDAEEVAVIWEGYLGTPAWAEIKAREPDRGVNAEEVLRTLIEGIRQSCAMGEIGEGATVQ